MTEYVIWGKEPNAIDESLLCTKVCGERITDKQTALSISKILEQKYLCTEVRIQTINISNSYNPAKEFINAIKK